MTHGVLIKKADFKDNSVSHIECNVNGELMVLCEREYTQNELDIFNRKAKNMIIECSGSKYFLSDTDAGEDAECSYCNYFDLDPEHAVFSDEELIGLYFSPNIMIYSGTARDNYSVTGWEYPGKTIKEIESNKFHLFIFADSKTHTYNGWKLLERQPDRKYEETLEF